MKKIISLILALCFIFSFSACNGSEDGWVPAGMKLASTDAVDYTLFVPSSWTVDVSTGIISAYVSDTDRSNITVAAFNLEGDDINLTLEEYWSKYETDLISVFPDVTYISPFTLEESEETAEADESAETKKLTYSESSDRCDNPVQIVIDGNVAANKYYYTATIGGTEMMYMQVVAIRASIAYILTYTATPISFDTHLEDVNSILEYFSFD